MGRFAAPDFDGHDMCDLKVEGARAPRSGCATSTFRVRKVYDARCSGCTRFRVQDV